LSSAAAKAAEARGSPPGGRPGLYLSDVFRTATFRLTLGASIVLAGVTLLEFSLIYWRTTAYEVERADHLLDREATLMAAQNPEDLQEQVRLWRTTDLRLLITAAGLFDADRKPIGGNLQEWPEELPVDGQIRRITVHPTEQGTRIVRAEALPVQGGRILVIARGLRDLQQIRAIVLAALETCLIPALAISLLTGLWLSRRALVRVGSMHRAIDRIMEGDLQERLPEGQGHDEMERMAASVNRMLGRLGRLLDEIKGVGDDIAHDLRTPLSRVRAALDRTRLHPHTHGELERVIERAIADLDQSFGVITALLRIAEIENGRRRAAFAVHDLREIARDIVELYEPLAETEETRLELAPGEPVFLQGDRDLLIELVANLVDNGLKFTPPGGRVRVAVEAHNAHAHGTQAVLRISDTGIGIVPEEREAVLGRFYRSDKSRHVKGSGLGLSLVSAIARLHEARIEIAPGEGPADMPGVVFAIMFPPLPPGTALREAAA